MNEEELKKLSALAEKATPGPWISNGTDGTGVSPITQEGGDAYSYAEKGSILCVSEWIVCEDADLELMAASREAVPQLIADNRRLKEALNTIAAIFELNGESEPLYNIIANIRGYVSLSDEQNKDTWRKVIDGVPDDGSANPDET